MLLITAVRRPEAPLPFVSLILVPLFIVDPASLFIVDTEMNSP